MSSAFLRTLELSADEDEEEDVPGDDAQEGSGALRPADSRAARNDDVNDDDGTPVKPQNRPGKNNKRNKIDDGSSSEGEDTATPPPVKKPKKKDETSDEQPAKRTKAQPKQVDEYARWKELAKQGALYTSLERLIWEKVEATTDWTNTALEARIRQIIKESAKFQLLSAENNGDLKIANAIGSKHVALTKFIEKVDNIVGILKNRAQPHVASHTIPDDVLFAAFEEQGFYKRREANTPLLGAIEALDYLLDKGEEIDDDTTFDSYLRGKGTPHRDPGFFEFAKKQAEKVYACLFPPSLIGRILLQNPANADSLRDEVKNAIPKFGKKTVQLRFDNPATMLEIDPQFTHIFRGTLWVKGEPRTGPRKKTAATVVDEPDDSSSKTTQLVIDEPNGSSSKTTRLAPVEPKPAKRPHTEAEKDVGYTKEPASETLATYVTTFTGEVEIPVLSLALQMVCLACTHPSCLALPPSREEPVCYPGPCLVCGEGPVIAQQEVAHGVF
jgi:hypothetical protein